MTEDQFNKAKDNRAEKREFLEAQDELAKIYKLENTTLECKRACDIANSALEKLIRMYEEAFNKI